MLRKPTLALLAMAMSIILLFYFMVTPDRSPSFAAHVDHAVHSFKDPSLASFDLTSILHGKPIMAKMQNMTIRAEVGNAGWKLIHTILAQYPENPTLEERELLRNFFSILSRVYPCQECALHFQKLLKDYPPQVSSRKAAVMWGCDAHNKVNRRLNKPIFDCATIDDKYDCGCGEGPEEIVRDDELEVDAPVVKGG